MITKEEAKAVAALARIQLTEEEEAHFQAELSQVIEFFAELESVNTQGVDPMNHITGRLGEARGDIPYPSHSDTETQIKRSFPENDEGYLAVKSVF